MVPSLQEDESVLLLQLIAVTQCILWALELCQCHALSASFERKLDIKVCTVATIINRLETCVGKLNCH